MLRISWRTSRHLMCDRPEACGPPDGRQRTDLVDMEVIVRRQDQEHCASITSMIRHYAARRAKVIFDHPHNADDSAPDG